MTEEHTPTLDVYAFLNEAFRNVELPFLRIADVDDVRDVLARYAAKARAEAIEVIGEAMRPNPDNLNNVAEHDPYDRGWRAACQYLIANLKGTDHE